MLSWLTAFIISFCYGRHLWQKPQRKKIESYSIHLRYERHYFLSDVLLENSFSGFADLLTSSSASLKSSQIIWALGYSTACPLLVGRELAVLFVYSCNMLHAGCKCNAHVKFWIKLPPVKVTLSNVVSCTLSTLFHKLTVITVLIFSQYYLTRACRCWRQTKTLLMSR